MTMNLGMFALLDPAPLLDGTGAVKLPMVRESIADRLGGELRGPPAGKITLASTRSTLPSLMTSGCAAGTQQRRQFP
jgi:hypothetical protein